MPATRETPSDNQLIQKRMLEEALKIPGVAAAVEVYGALQPFVPVKRDTPTVIRVATGGNT